MKRPRDDSKRIMKANDKFTKEYENDTNNDYKHKNMQHIQMITISNDNEKNMVEKQVTDSLTASLFFLSLSVTASLLHCYTAHCCTASLLDCYTAASVFLFFYHSPSLLRCYIATLLTAALLHCFTATLRLQFFFPFFFKSLSVTSLVLLTPHTFSLFTALSHTSAAAAFLIVLAQSELLSEGFRFFFLFTALSLSLLLLAS